MWTQNSFDGSHHLTDKEPIQSNVVMQLHPDTGETSWLGCWLAG